MGQMSTEQTVQIIDAVGNAQMKAEPNMNFSYLLLLAVVPVVLGYWLNKRRKK
jgi:hypothetical protein